VREYCGAPRAALGRAVAAGYLFSIRLVDKTTGRGIPRVSLSTPDRTVWLTDSAGYAAVQTIGREGLHVYFTIATGGYEVPADSMFGIRGALLLVRAGGSAVVEMLRTQRAERLYRLASGQGCNLPRTAHRRWLFSFYI
jgi:hypothetical protein